MEAVDTKVCKKCGRELPLSDYHTDKRMIGGYKNICRDCIKQYTKEKAEELKEVKELNPLSCYKPRELIEELRRRGYKGKLQLVLDVVV